LFDFNVGTGTAWWDDVFLYGPVQQTEPELSYSPTSYDFGDKCEGVTDSTTFEIWNSGTGTLTYILSESCGWVVGVNPTSGSSTGEHDTITVDIDTTGLSEGYHTCNISISSNDGSGTFTVTVNIIGELRTFITTDKYEYHPGDTMTITLDIKNPTASSVDTYFVWLLILPDYSYYQPMLVTRLTLPPYFDQTFNMDIYVGNCATIGFNAEWYVALLETSAPYEIICDDNAEWRYDPVPVSSRDTDDNSKGGSAPPEEVVPEQIAEAIMKSIGEIALPVELVQEEEITEEILDAILD
jgi:hypothetical protein